MVRKRHRKKKKIQSTPKTHVNNKKLPASPAAQKLAERIASGGVNYVEQNFVRVMEDSAQLLEEPEFQDIYLDSEKTIQATERWLDKYKKRLEEAERKGKKHLHLVVDEMRIDMISELVTPKFRREIRRRLKRIMDRLITSDDLDKLELALLLQPILTETETPWGICGLILAIYYRTLEEATGEYREEESFYKELESIIEDEGGDIEVFRKLQDQPDKLAQLGKKITALPNLQKKMEEYTWDLIKAFEMELLAGKVELDLFSKDEILMLDSRFREEYGEPDTELETAGEEHAKRVIIIVRELLDEIMTPERKQELCEDVRKTAKKWGMTRRKWGAALQAELGWLEDDSIEENPFYIAAYMGQVFRMSKDWTLGKTAH